MIVEQVLLSQFCGVASSRDVVPAGQKLLFADELLAAGRA